MSVVTHMLAGGAFGPCRGKGTGELSLAHDLREHVPPNSLLIGDKQFLAYAMLNALSQLNATDPTVRRHWLVPAKKNTKWTVIERLGSRDALVELKLNSRDRRNNPSLPASMRVRAIPYKRKGFRPRTLLTSLLDPEAYPADEISAVFRQREEIELGYDELKTHMLERQETLRSKLPVGVRQEIWGILAAYNVVRHKMVGIAKQANLPVLRVSFRHTLQLLRLSWLVAAWTPNTDGVLSQQEMVEVMIGLIVLPERRSHRYHRRHVKIRMSSYPRNPGRSRTGKANLVKSERKAAI